MSSGAGTGQGDRIGEFVAVLDIEPALTVGSSNAEDSPVATKAVIDYYIKHGVIEAGQAHGLHVGILAERGTRVRVISSWPNSAAYQSWLDAPERASLLGEMGALIDTINGITVSESHLHDHLGVDDIVVHRVVSVC